jgi:myo-inositol-1(or 4)-monophosphatase
VSPVPARPASTPPDPRAADLHALLTRAGEAALARVASLSVSHKADGSEVTDADMAANEVLTEGLSRLFPGEAIVSEEGQHEPAAGARAVWYIDPIDGTGAFTEGLAHWGPTVCRVVDGKLDVGAFVTPRLGESWFAAEGGGAWRNGVQLHPAPVPSDPRQRSVYMPSRAHRLASLDWRGRTRSLGCSAAHLALVASGGAVAAVLPTWAVWDVGCGILLVRESGRVVVDLSGAAADPMDAIGAPFIAADASVVEPLTHALRAALAQTPRI